MSTANTIAEMLDMSRKFTLFYIGKFDPAKIHHRPVIDGRPANSPYWIMGHLVWAEADGVLGCCGGVVPDIPWLQDFAFGKKVEEMGNAPAYPDLLKSMNDVHALCLAHIKGMSEEDLELPAYVPPMNWNTVRKKALYHFVRHEGFHTGQLAIFAKTMGAEAP